MQGICWGFNWKWRLGLRGFAFRCFAFARPYTLHDFHYSNLIAFNFEPINK